MVAQRRTATHVVLMAIVVVGLVFDAIVHFRYASAFSNKTSVISETTIFRIQATVALLAALGVLVRPRRYTAAFAFAVAASALVAVVLYRYVDVGKLGPLPNMYDPYWAPAGKWLSAIGEALAAVAAAGLFATLPAGSQARGARRPRRRAAFGV